MTKSTTNKKKKLKKKKKESQISKPYTEDKTARSPGDFRLREKGQPVCSWGNGKLVLGLHTLPSVSASPNPTSTDSTRDFHWSLSAFGGLSNPPSERFSNNHSVSVLYCPGAKSPWVLNSSTSIRQNQAGATCWPGDGVTGTRGTPSPGSPGAHTGDPDTDYVGNVNKVLCEQSPGLLILPHGQEGFVEKMQFFLCFQFSNLWLLNHTTVMQWWWEERNILSVVML